MEDIGDWAGSTYFGEKRSLSNIFLELTIET